jgi:GTPase SAR1 family protein
MAATDYIYKTKEVLKQFIRFIEDSPWKDKYLVQLQQLLANMDDPCRLAIAGQVKAGKSSLVNALLGVNLAKVGTTETTATINIFRYGTPPNANKPVLCQYCDGREEWVTKDFLDSLQGTTQEGLKKASEIKNLTYFVNDLRLQDVILIDTPGTNAVVDKHTEQTELYFGLRQRHNEETIEISNKADAVVYLLGEVAHESNQDFLSSLKDTMGQKSNVNTIGVMSQIDVSDDRLLNKKEHAKEIYQRLSFYVSTVVPISAGLQLFLPSKEEASRMKSVLTKFGSEENLNNCLLKGEKVFLLPTLPGIQLSVEERKSIRHLEDGMPWRVFVVIAREIYKQEVDAALTQLAEYSGMNNLQNILNKHFFDRSKILKCNNIVEVMYNILNKILKYGGLDELKEEAVLKEKCLQECDNLSPETAKIIHKMIETQLKSPLYIQNVEKILSAIKEKVLNIRLITDRITKDFYCLQILNSNREKFAFEEIEELTRLFTYNTTMQWNESRRAYWQEISYRSMSEEKQSIAKRACQKYDEL